MGRTTQRQLLKKSGVGRISERGHSRRQWLKGVAQTSKSAVSPISNRQGVTMARRVEKANGPQAGSPAMQQTWKSALRGAQGPHSEMRPAAWEKPVLPYFWWNRESDLKDRGRDGESNKAFPLTPPSPPGSTAIELSAYGSKYDLFDTSLKIIRTMEREFSSWDFSIWPNAYRRSQEKLLQFFDHLLRRNVTVQQRQQLILQRVE